jgi:dTDP-4-dehydrorhamnose 3,5-epimerase
MINEYFKIKTSKIGLKIYKPTFNSDHRGEIWTSYKSNFFPNLDFKHDRFTFAKKNTLRGLHGDKVTWKLLTCIYGEIFVVVVDNNNKSKNFYKYESFNLNKKNKSIILIPPRMLLGWCCISKEAIVSYKMSYKGSYVDHDKQITVKWNDPKIKIKWPIKKPILSERDKANI